MVMLIVAIVEFQLEEFRLPLHLSLKYFHLICCVMLFSVSELTLLY